MIAFTAMAHEASAPSTTKSLYNMYEGDSTGRQLSETVATFLSRCPPLTTHILNHGPWIYIANPRTKFRASSEDRAAFKARGQELLEDFKAVKTRTEASMAGKAKATISKKLAPSRKKLETDILAAAKEKGCTSGKWMLFPMPDDVNSWWSLVAHGTAAGELGHAAKVATDDGSGDRQARLICIYTENFEDKADVKRVLERLVGMGLVKRKGPVGEERGIYYKADAYTYLDIMGGNEWGLRPSMYSSKEILAEEEK